LIATLGLVLGIKVALIVTLVLAVAVLTLQYFAYQEDPGGRIQSPSISARSVLVTMPAPLVRLLVADCLVRIGEGLAASFIVLFVLEVHHASPATYGLLYAVQQSVAIASYLPGGRFADLTGRRPIVVLTFIFFALFPLAVRLASTEAALFAAFVIGGLKEIGEPARKSLIVDLAPDAHRARTVGLYYAIRNFLVVPAGLVGGLLWQRAPHLPLEAAFAVSALGTVAYLLSTAANREG
jgi:predicted MFS family arabinose efflux permease